MLRNLLHNAAQLSPHGAPITVGASAVDSHVAVTVGNQGPGIPAEDLPNLFNRYYWVDDHGSGRFGRRGLRLAISKGIIEAHGGRLWAESDGPGRGARFTFTIPVAAIGGAADGDAASPHQTQATVLAIDGDSRALRLVRDTLSEAGYSPLVTGDREEAIHAIRTVRPQLILLGVALNGTEDQTYMRRILAMSDAPVILLSDRGRERDLATAFDLGAIDYIVKPFSAVELASRVRMALSRRGARGQSRLSETLPGGLAINHEERTVALAGKPVELTATEYALLVELARNVGRVLTREQLLQRVWGRDSTDGSGPLRTCVKCLREKLGDDAGNPTYIVTERGVGYRMPRVDGSGG